jgi:hypothetical protein
LRIIYDVGDPSDWGAKVKLLGWIKSAVGFFKTTASPQQAGPPPEAPAQSPPAIDEEPERAGPDQPADRLHIPVGAAPEPQIDTEAESASGGAPEQRISVEPEGPPSQEEIDRRRAVVRAFFNDYWSSIDDKPASFAERLDKAEDYINERVAAGGEAWRLGAATRKQLGLPPSKKR